MTNFNKEEHGIDPNRDFPYDKPADNCFKTNISRAFNEALQSHLVASAITFHGGDNSITYPYGNFPHLKERSPDEYAFESVAARLQKVTGKNYGPLGRGIKQYKIGTMTKIVYACHGPYEDFVYAGSFD